MRLVRKNGIPYRSKDCFLEVDVRRTRDAFMEIDSRICTLNKLRFGKVIRKYLLIYLLLANQILLCSVYDFDYEIGFDFLTVE